MVILIKGPFQRRHTKTHFSGDEPMVIMDAHADWRFARNVN